MRIGIDARFWSQTGIGRYIRNIVEELSKLDTKNEYVIFLMGDDFDSISLPSNFKKVKTNIHWHSFSEQIILPMVYLKEHLDLLFVPHFNIPILYPKKIVTTIHDLTVLRVRTGKATALPYPIYLIKYLGAFLVHCAAIKRSKIIFTVSQFVKDDIVKTFKVDPSKIVFTPNAVGGGFYRRSGNEINAVLEKYGFRHPYLFYVGNAYPHKNLKRLVESFAILLKDFPNLTLVLGGKKDFFYERLEKECKALDVCDRIVFTGFINDIDLPAIYSGAKLFVNPSLYEGFGIQVLEAFGCGCKVVCSSATSLPEVGGGLARYFDPKDAHDMARIISKTLLEADPGFTSRAAVYAKDYSSWEASAKTILLSMQKT